MTEWVSVNGDIVEADRAKISVFDRGFLFADSVYEVTSIINGHLVDFDGHYDRLERSCAALGIVQDLEREKLRAQHLDLARQNGLTEGLIYLQVTGGVGPRDFLIDRTIKPTVVIFTMAKAILDNPLAQTGLAVITIEDTRWSRRDIKTTQLLSQSLAKSEAVKAGADDAWMVAGGFVNEGSTNNAFIVTRENSIITAPGTRKILSGITRAAVMECIKMHGLTLELRAFSVAEAQAAKEAFITSASAFVLPVVKIDGVTIGSGKPGEISQSLRLAYIKRALA